MDKKIKQYVDARDLTSLKYIFVDSLDVDPTFEQYEEAYQCCKSAGLLEQHIELTPFANDPAQWTEAYWTKLKMDLKKNFSDQRMSHMRKVAAVLLADKAQRIRQERQAAFESTAEVSTKSTPQASVRPIGTAPRAQSALLSAAEQEKALQEDKQRLEAENKRVAEQEARQHAAIAAKREALKKEKQQEAEGAFPKKAAGIAIAVAAVAVVLFLLLK